MAKIYGIDVSKYQNEIDWKKVRAAGKSFVFVRLGWAGWDGVINLDSMAYQHIKNAAAAGMDVGVYVYSYCKTPEAARFAAKSALGLISPYAPFAYPIAFDMEDISQNGVPYHTFEKSFNNAIAAAFLDEIEKAGYYGMLYTYKSFAENYLDMNALKKYDVWIAQYASSCGYAGSYGIWQYAGDTGRCDGVSGACDLNVAYKDYAAIIRAAGLNGFSKAAAGNPDAQPSPDELEQLKEQNRTLAGKVAQLEDKLKQILELAS